MFISTDVVRGLQYVLATRNPNVQENPYGDNHPPSREREIYFANEGAPTCSGKMDRTTVRALRRLLRVWEKQPSEGEPLFLDKATIISFKKLLNRPSEGRASSDAATLDSLAKLDISGPNAGKITDEFENRLRAWLNYRLTLDSMYSDIPTLGRWTVAVHPVPGAKVVARYHTMETCGKLFPAKIVSVNVQSRTATVNYDDGDQWENAPWFLIAPRNPPFIPEFTVKRGVACNNKRADRFSAIKRRRSYNGIPRLRYY
mmetsp:Transcript_1137/g.1896  ORF Transcript_1137/g.1896 Transcript_1137/m.1896 type:complete len:258 (-) Transcript_1137:528-1301(-)